MLFVGMICYAFVEVYLTKKKVTNYPLEEATVQTANDDRKSQISFVYTEHL